MISNQLKTYDRERQSEREKKMAQHRPKAKSERGKKGKEGVRDRELELPWQTPVS